MPFKKQHLGRSPYSGETKGIFIARANELLFFIHDILEPEEPTHNIIAISGQGGVGKSTLVNRFMEEACTTNFKEYCLVARVDERQTTAASVIERFADQLGTTSQPLKEFEKALTRYKEAARRTGGERDEEQEGLIREAVDLAGTVVEDLPLAGGLGGLVHKEANTLTGLIMNEAQRKQYLKDAATLEDPLRELTRAFVNDLNHITEIQVHSGPRGTKRPRRVILFFDTFEQLASTIVPWLLDYFLETEISPNVVLVVAGRDPLDHSLPDDPKRWLPYSDNGDMYAIALQSFTEEETTAYLKERGTTDSTKVKQIWHLSRGLPLWLGLLTSNPEGRIDPTADVVENFLRWIPKQEPHKRRLALDAALLSLPFNQDNLAAFPYVGDDAPALYEWLVHQPFVLSNPQDGRHSYHEVAQEMFGRHLYQRSHEDECTTRQMIANYYLQRLEQLQREGGKDIYTSAEWLDFMLASAQQLFLLPDQTSHNRATEQVLIAYEFAREPETIARMLRNLAQFIQERASHHILAKMRQVIEQLLQCIEADQAKHKEEHLSLLGALLEHVTSIPSFSMVAIAYLYRRRGRTYRALERHEQAIQDCKHALDLSSQYKQAYLSRGNIYRDLKEYERAIEDYTQALNIDSQYKLVYHNRGLAYYDFKKYEQAIEDYTHALDIDPQYKSAYNNRGCAYSALKEYEQAIEDYTHALNIDPQYSIAYYRRGRAYSALKEYECAIQDYTHALDINPQNKWAYASRGDAYRKLKKYEQAIQDYTYALDIDPQYIWPYFSRGYVYLWQRDLLRAKDEFLKSWQLNSATVIYGWMIASVEMCLQEKPDITMAERLETYARLNLQNYVASICQGVAQWLRGNLEQALEELEQASKLNPNSESALFWKGIVYASLQEDDAAMTAIEKSLELDLPPVLLAPLRWFEQDRPEFYEKYAKPLLARFE